MRRCRPSSRAARPRIPRRCDHAAAAGDRHVSRRNVAAETIDWQPGDRLALVTDGLLEVFDAQDRELGLEWAQQVLVANRDRPLVEIAERLLTGARQHGPQLGDQTLLLIRNGLTR